MCGSAEIDGYAFCLGVGSLNVYNADLDLRSIIRSVTYLIRGAIFRPSYAMSGSGKSSLDICPLGELIDMYHTHEATELHDKVFALLGMSNDNLNKASLSPNYGVPWEELLQDLVKFLLYDKISIETLGDKQIALIKSKGCILGNVSLMRSDIAWDDSEGVDIIFNNTSNPMEYKEERSTRWTLHNSANSIQDGDLVCLLQGASKPTIIRLHDDHFDIIMITATLPEEMLKLSQSMEPFSRDFLLIWDWEKLSREVQDLEHETLLQTKNWASEPSKIGFEDHLEKATRSWKAAMILEDSAKYEKAQEKIQEAINGYEIAAVGGHQAMVKHLLKTGEVDVNFKHKDGTTPLGWAAKEGHNTMVKLLLGTGEVNIDPKHEDGTTPLWWAVKGGYLAIVERLLQEKADVNAVAAEYDGRTVLQAAAERGHLAIVERLLEEKAEVNAAAARGRGRTALQAAAERGHLAVIERLLEEKAEVNAVAAKYDGRTALQAAAERGYLAVIERLLEEKADVNAAAAVGGISALEAAKKEGCRKFIEYICQAGATR
jgi:ankyrin repeat protein